MSVRVALDTVLRDLLEGSEIHLFRVISPLQEALGYEPRPADWKFRDAEASTQHRIEFTQGGQKVAGWYATRDGEVKAAQSFPQGPYEIRIAGDAIRFDATVQAAAMS